MEAKLDRIRNLRGGGKDAAVLLFYGAVTAVMTYPAATVVSRTYAEPRDPLGVLWWLWWYRYSFINHLPVMPVPTVIYPWGLKTSIYSQDQLFTLMMRGFTMFAKETVAYNIVLLLSFFLSAAAMYYLVRWLTRNRGAAAFSGLAFGFCPYLLAQGKEHLGMAATFWLPLFALLLIRAWSRRSWGSIAAGAIVFIALTLYNSQYGLLAAIFGVSYILIYWLSGRPWKHRHWDWGLFFKGLTAVSVICVVALILVVGLVLSPAGKPKAAMGAYQYSARPWDYFIPSAESAVFGGLTEGFIFNHLHEGFLVESSLFLGYTVMVLALYALIGTFVRRRLEPSHVSTENSNVTVEPGPARLPRIDEKRTIWAFTGCAVVAFILSMPPTATLFGTKIYLPSYVFTKLLPQFRAYARFGLVVMMCVAVLAGFGLSRLLESLPRNVLRSALVIILMALVIVEFTIVPPFYSLDTKATTDYYRWLEDQPGKQVVAIYPLFTSDDFANYGYFFAQRLHGKDLVNGAKSNTMANRYRESILDIKNPSTPGMLKRLGTKYVMVIPSLYEGSALHATYHYPVRIEEDDLPAGLEPVRRFEDCIVCEVTAPPAEFIPVFVGGNYSAYTDPEGRTWHPAINKAFVNINSELERQAVCDIKLRMMSVKALSRVTIEVNGTRLAAVDVPVWPVDVAVPDVVLNPGYNRVKIESDGPRGGLFDVYGYENIRVAMLLGDVTVEKKR